MMRGFDATRYCNNRHGLFSFVLKVRKVGNDVVRNWKHIRNHLRNENSIVTADIVNIVPSKKNINRNIYQRNNWMVTSVMKRRM